MALDAQLTDLIDRFLPLVQDFHRKHMFAPNAASLDAAGEITGHALTTDGRTEVSASQGMELLQGPLLAQAKSGEITGVAVFYHSTGLEFDVPTKTVSFPPATNTDDCRALVGILEHVAGDSVYLMIPYSGSPPDITYGVGKLIEKPPRYFGVASAPTEVAITPIEVATADSPAKKSWWKRW